MPIAKSFSKISKLVNKKKGKAHALHEHSRDSRRLQRASGRDVKLANKVQERERANQVHLQRLSILQASALDHDPLTPYTIPEILSEIQTILKRNDESLSQIKSERRAGRPPSTQEIQLTALIENDKKEYVSGFWIPDMTDVKNLEKLREWGGQWIGLNVLKFVRVFEDGRVVESSFPPRGRS
ncbi:hypothetical protein EG328_007923 [Venturia inaequalis]|uniref:Translation machinery-associated protein 16 n=1 Tax=Venturia inaequalis TaxID=5025 RepID=A0A8H3YSL8_VENIN|nr:hypothetical protein EG328_007923 [Venturia inaequalis]KAE9980746.1 hypothetical protein EG327_006438 [Venturia inaequalis]RDI84145.1 hypothetical protein Vi05172_g5880 [Venturia inaequalis]